MRSIQLCVLSLSLLAPPALAQAPPPSQRVDLSIDSGLLSHGSAQSATIFSQVVRTPGAAWLRLYLDEALLPAGSFLRITSLLDGSEQQLNAEQVAQWQRSTAYFNGDAVLVEIVAAPASGEHRLALRDADVGLAVSGYESQCGNADDRVPSSRPGIARLLPAGCTGWIIDDACGCMLAAGHCNILSTVDTIQFNVPLSQSNGTLVHPAPEFQFALDPASLQENFSPGDDWMYYGVFPNSNTGLTPFELEGFEFTLADPLPDTVKGQFIRITGFGVDSGSANQTQQTHLGRRVEEDGAHQVEYQVDTEGGNSGSPIVFQNAGDDVAIGIHTNGGCDPPNDEGNWGTAYSQPALKNALANPGGVCLLTGGESYGYGAGVGGSNVGTLGTASAPNAGTTVDLDVTGIPGGTGGVLWASFDTADVPLLGGTLLADLPAAASFPVVLAGGAGSVSVSIPSTASGLIVYWQAIVNDAGQSEGFAFTNGLKTSIL